MRRAGVGRSSHGDVLRQQPDGGRRLCALRREDQAVGHRAAVRDRRNGEEGLLSNIGKATALELFRLSQNLQGRFLNAVVEVGP